MPSSWSPQWGRSPPCLLGRLGRSPAREARSLPRRLTPARVADQHVPVVTFLLLLVVYAIVTFERINLCMRIGVEHCR